MAVWQERSKRKVSGGRYRSWRDKKKKALGRQFSASVIGEKTIKKIRTLGSNAKFRLKKIDYVSVLDKSTGKIMKEPIKAVEKNPANRHYGRLGILTKGAVIELESGKKARITSRPGQDGTLNAVLIE